MKRTALVVALIALPIFGAAPVQSQTASPGETVLATVNGEPVTAIDLQIFYSSLPAQYRQVPIERIYQQVLERLIDQKLLAAAAREKGFADRPEVKRELTLASDNILQESYLQTQISPQITEDRLREAYKSRIETEPQQEEVHARHILLKSESKAKEVIAELETNSDFAAMARKHSTGPTGPSGGDLGFFEKSAMVPEFAEAAFAMKAGETSPLPVKTQFGWHVIKVEARRTAPTKSYDELESELRQAVGAAAYQKIVEDLRTGAKVTYPQAK